MDLPKMDRNAYEEQMRAEFDAYLREVADAVDNAPQGRVIRDSEEKARDALDRFRKTAYEKADPDEGQRGGSRFSPLRTAPRRERRNGIKESSPAAS